MKKRRPYRYILGSSPREARRLAFQARVWKDMTEGLFNRLNVGPGWRCLEVGAGTGSTFFPLARRVKSRGGLADAVERSPRYAAALKREAARLGFSHARVFNSEILQAPLEPGFYDLIFARWVFIFLPRVEEHLRALAAALKPGGILAIEDYHRGGLALYPRFKSWEHLIKADPAWFASQGGDINVAGRLPSLYRRAGLEIVEVVPHIKAGGPGSDVWKWAEDYFIGYLDEIARFKPFTPRRARRFRADWLKAKRDPGSLLISPVILDVVGRRPAKRPSSR